MVIVLRNLPWGEIWEVFWYCGLSSLTSQSCQNSAYSRGSVVFTASPTENRHRAEQITHKWMRVSFVPISSQPLRTPIPESTKPSYVQGEELVCPFLLQLGILGDHLCVCPPSQWWWSSALWWSSESSSSCTLMIPGTGQGVLFSLRWTAKELHGSLLSLSSGSAGADADGPYLCSGIMHTQRCTSKTPFRTTSWWRVWSADDFLLFFIQDPSQFMLRAPSRHWLSKIPIISAQGRPGLMGKLGLGASHWAAESVSVLT